MIYYCRNHQEIINPKKVLAHCLPKKNCWALVMLASMRRLKKKRGKLILNAK